MMSRGFARAALAVLCASAAAIAQQGTGDVLLLTASCANPTAQLRTSGCGAGALTALVGVLPTDAITLTATYLPASPPTGPVPFVLVAGRRECPVAGGPPLYVGLANPSPLVLAGQFGPGALSISMVVPAGALAAGLPLSPAVQSPVVQMAAASCSVPGALVMSGAVQLDVQNVVAGSSSLGAGAAALTGLQVALTPAHAALGTIDPLGLQVHPGGGDLLTAIATGLNAGGVHALTFTSGADVATVPVTFSHFPGFSIASGVPIPGFCVGNAVAVALTEDGAPAAPAPGNLLFPVSVAPQPAGVNSALAPTHVASDFAAPNAFFPVFASQLVSLHGQGFFGPTEAASTGTVAGLCAGSGCLSQAIFTELHPGSAGVVPCSISAATSSLLMELGTPTAIAAQCGQPFTGGQKPTFGPWAVGVRNVACVDATQSLVGAFPTLFLADLPPSNLAVYPRVVAQKNGAAAARIRVYGADFFHRDPSSATDVAQDFVVPLLSALALPELKTPAVTFSTPGSSAPLNLAPRVVFVSETELEVTVPAGLPVGAYDVRVYNPDGRMASVSSAFEVVPPLTKGDAAPPITNLFGTGIDLPTTLDGAWLAQVLAAQAQASTAAPVSFGTHPPVLVVANPQADSDSGGLPLGATTIPAEQRKPFELAFLFNTRAADGKPRFFDFEAVDLPAELAFQDFPALSGALSVTLPEMSTAPGYFREITLFGSGVGTGVPPGPDQYQSVRVVVKACAFYLDATTGSTPRPRVRFHAEENYPLVVRSRDLLAVDAYVDLSGGALAPNDGGAADAQALIRERTEYAPAPAGGGLGGRGGVHFSRSGISVGVDSELATSVAEGAKVLADATSGIAVVTFNPSPPLIAGEAGHAPSARQLLSDAGGLITTSSQTGLQGGGGGAGSGIVGNKVAGGGGGSHADLRPPFATPLLPDVVSSAGVSGVNSPGGAAAQAYGTPLLAPLVASPATILSEALRIPADGRYVFGDAGYSFAAGGVLGGPFPYRAASRFDLPALNAPASAVAGDVAFAAPAQSGADFTFPLPLFSGGSGGGGGGGSLAIFVPWISVGGRGGNGGGALVLVSDGVLRVGPNGRLRADGETGRSGSHVFPVPNANVFYPLSLPGAGGGGGGGLIAAYALSDVTFTDTPPPGGTVLPAAPAPRASANNGAPGDDVGPASEGGTAGTGRLRFAVHRKATLSPRPATLPPHVAAPFANWSAEFLTKNGTALVPDPNRTYSVSAPTPSGALPDPTDVTSLPNPPQIID